MDFLYSDRTALTVLRANQGQLGGFIPSVKIARNELSEINPTAAAMNAVYDQEGVNRPDPLLRNPAWAQVVSNFVAPQPGLVDIQKAAIQGQADYATLARQYDAANNAALDAAIAAAQKEGAKVCRELLVFRNFNGTKSYTTRDYAGLPGCN